MSEITQIPGSIVKAVCAVQTTIDAVKKSQKNQHGGYMFASTDDIYAGITQKMGKVGLLCLALEDEAEIQRHQNKDGKEVPWVRAVYRFVLATEDASWSHPKSRRTVLVQITGPQTFQAAQSYAEKSYLRSLFKIPTGDMDLDSMPDSYEYNPIFKPQAANSATPPMPPAPPEPPAAEARTAPEFNKDAFMAHVEARLSEAQDTDTLAENWVHLEGEMEEHLSRSEREEVLAIYERHEARLAAETAEEKAYAAG